MKGGSCPVNFIKRAVAIATCAMILCCSVLPPISAFAAENKTGGVDSRGYEFFVDENGIVYYEEPIPLFEDIFLYDNRIALFQIIDGTSAFKLVYEVVEQVPNLTIVGGAAAGGAAATGGTVATGALATIAGLSAGQVVLFSALAAGGIIALTQPDMVETLLNDIWFYLDAQTQAKLGNMYFQDTWLVDSDVCDAINSAISDIVFISDGVIWNQSLTIGMNDLTGLTDSFPTTPITVENGALDELEIDYAPIDVDSNAWMTMDSNRAILYRMDTKPFWSKGNLADWNAHGGQYFTNMTIFNSRTGVECSAYLFHTNRFWVFGTGETDYIVGEPVFIDDGEKVGVEIVYGGKPANQTYYPCYGFSSLHLGSETEGGNGKFPIIMNGTGTIIDGLPIYNVDFDADKGLFNYFYHNPDGTTGSAYFPLEPFHWTFSQSEPSSADDNAGAIDTITKTEPTIDEYGKIEITPVGAPEVPQLKPVEVPKLDTETAVDPENGTETEVSTWPSTGVNPNPNPNPNPDANPGVDPENPNQKDFTGWITAVFNLTGLFDWLPEKYSTLFDSIICTAGTLILVMVVWAIWKVFF